MQSSLAAAVGGLLNDPRVAGLPDVARLAAVVLMAKASSTTAVTRIWAAELGRWMGVSESTVDHAVLPALRKSGAMRSWVVTDENGHPTALDCLLVPLKQGLQAPAGNRHPLALSRPELATLLRLLEALIGPGWTPQDRAPTPAGALAARRGRGAATDRLALVLLALHCRADGWARLCPGTVDKGRGRPAATLGRLLGCKAATAARVLARLQDHGVAETIRRQTASQLHAQSRLRVVPVARAHRLRRPGHRATALQPAAIPDHHTAALGNLDVARLGLNVVSPAKTATGCGFEPAAADNAAAALHHTSHTPVVHVVGETKEVDGFSGEAKIGGAPRGRKRAYERGKQPPLVGVSVLGEGVEADPLRGDNQKISPLGAARWTTPPFGRVPAVPQDLRSVLEPVEALWIKLTRPGARATVVMAARSALGAVAQWTVPCDAPGVLRERLAYRLDEQGGAETVKDPVGWLLSRGLPRRGRCADPRCDDGTDLISGQPCPVCATTLAERRETRRAIWRQVKTCRPAAAPDELRAAAEAAIRGAVQYEAALQQVRWEQGAAHRRKQEERLRAERAAAQAALEADSARACSDCGTERAAGLCQRCIDRRAVSAAADRAVEAHVAAIGDLEDALHVAMLADEAEQAFHREIRQTTQQIHGRGATAEVVSACSRLAAEDYSAAQHSKALEAMTRRDEAQQEWRASYAMVMRSAHRYKDRETALKAAQTAADRARGRAAQALLGERMALVARLRHPSMEVTPEPAPQLVTLLVEPDGDQHAEGIQFRQRLAARRRARESASV